MKPGLRRILGIVGILLLFGLVLGALGPNLLSLTSNLCDLSGSDIRIENSVTDFSGDKAWSILTSTGCDNKIFGGSATLPANQISTRDGTATRDFTLGLTSFEAWFYQEIQDSRTPVYTVQPKDINCGGLFGCGSEAHAACDDYQNDPVESPKTSPSEFRYEYDSGDSSGWHLYCTRVNQVGAVSELAFGQGTDFSSTFTASAVGRSDSDTISKQDSVAKVRVGDVNGDFDAEHAHITWVGSLAGELTSLDLDAFHATCNNDCEQTTNQISWTVGDRSFYTQYATYDSGSFKACIESELDAERDGAGNPASCVNVYNSNANNVFLDASKGIKNHAGFEVKEVRTQNGQIQVVADRGSAVDRPAFRIVVDADWIGFEQPMVEPRFVSVPDVTVVGNSQTTAAVEVKNVGDSGVMQVFVECPNTPISGGSDTESVTAGDTAQFLIPLSAGPTETREYQCTVTAQDTDADTKATMKTTSLTVHAKTSCVDSDGDGVCNQNDACKSTPGIGSNRGCPLEETCGNGVDDNGNGRVDEGCENPPGPGFFARLLQGLGAFGDSIGSGIDGFLNDFNQAVTNPVQNWLTLFDIIAASLAAVAAFGIVRLPFVQPFIETVAAATPLSEAQLRLVLGIVFALLVGYAVYTAISSIVVKVLLLAGLLLGTYAYLQVKAVVPG